MPETSARYTDVLDIRFQRMFRDELKLLYDPTPQIFTMVPTNGRPDMRWSDVGELEDFAQFTGLVNYDQQYEGYDVVLSPVEFAKGTSVERALMDDDQQNMFDTKPKAMANSAHRTRMKHAAQVYNKAFDVSNDFYVHSEGVALCSNSHTTRSGASTASGFDNLGTSALSATAVETARQQMIGYRDDRANLIQVMPNQITTGPANAEVAHEIVYSRGKVDTANNNANFNQDAYQIFIWNYILDTNDWFMEDTQMRRDSLFWTDRVALEFAMVEDFDTLYAKWRGYMRYGWAWRQWRFIFGAQVS